MFATLLLTNDKLDNQLDGILNSFEDQSKTFDKNTLLELNKLKGQRILASIVIGGIFSLLFIIVGGIYFIKGYTPYIKKFRKKIKSPT